MRCSADLAPPGAPTACLSRISEASRFSWSVADGGDPAALLEEYLVDQGFAVGDLNSPTAADPHGHGRSGAPCGAAVLVSAAAGARMAGFTPPVGAAGPAPGVPDLVAVVYRHGPARPTSAIQAAQRRPWWLGHWRDSWTVDEHARAVAAVRAAIGRGDVYQVNVVGHASAPYEGDPLPALARVAALHGARYGGVLTGPGAVPGGDGWAVACASPETLVQVAAGRAVTRPIKGTRPATVDGRRELVASAKERAEHVMIVDLERNDLARVARTGSVRVDELYAVRRWVQLWQAESTVSAQLADGTGLADLLRALCPGGSVTGAPKLAALAEIAVLEPVGRGPSMGALGWVSAGAPVAVDLGLTIRTVAVTGDRLHVWAGGGITWDSDPMAEVAEAAAKAAPLRAALRGRLRGA